MSSLSVASLKKIKKDGLFITSCKVMEKYKEQLNTKNLPLETILIDTNKMSSQNFFWNSESDGLFSLFCFSHFNKNNKDSQYEDKKREAGPKNPFFS